MHSNCAPFLSLRAAVSLLLLAAALCGCGINQRVAVDVGSAAVTPDLPATIAAPFSGTRYHAYGDSITFGATLSDPSTLAFPALLANDLGLTLTNSAIGGRMACDLAVEEIFPAGDSPTLNDGTLYSVLVSTNDIDLYGAGAYESTFTLCHLAASSWLAMPEERKIRATASSVTTSGPNFIDNSNHWGAVVTNALGASVSFPLSLSLPGPVYLWYHGIDNNTGTFAIAIDGVDQVQVATAASPHMLTGVGHPDSLAVVRLPAVPAGFHTLAVRQTSAGSAGAWVIAAGVAPPPAFSGLPLVIVGTTPKYLAGSDFVCAINDSPCRAYTADIEAIVQTLEGDNLNVYLFDSRRYETGTSADMTDRVHPNALGHKQLEHTIRDLLD